MRASIALAALFVVACGNSGPMPPADLAVVFDLQAPPRDLTPPGDMALQPTWTSLYNGLIASRCAGCHGTAGDLAMDDKPTAYASLVGKPATTFDCAGRTRVVAGNASMSLIWQKVTGTMLCGPKMPFESPPLSTAQADVLGAWINGGALDN